MLRSSLCVMALVSLCACASRTYPGSLSDPGVPLQRHWPSTAGPCKNQIDTHNPTSALTYANGTLYGATSNAMYAVTLAGTETVLGCMITNNDISQYQAPVYGAGIVYDTISDEASSVFAFTTSGAYKLIYQFPRPGAREGPAPFGLVALNGNLYGTVQDGDASADTTAYRLSPTGSTIKMIYTFPRNMTYAGTLTNINGTLYGTTRLNPGYLYSLTPNGALKILHIFKGNGDGEYPCCSNVISVNGTLYGATAGGGAHNKGAIYSVAPNGVERVIYSFAGKPDGESPTGNLAYLNGVIYGTTYHGGYAPGNLIGYGTMFGVTLGGNETVVHTFTTCEDMYGCAPLGGVTNVNGTLYGTAEFGGAHGEGTVFSYVPGGSLTILHTFQLYP